MVKNRKYLYFLLGFMLLYILSQALVPKAIDWTPTFAHKDKIPYGTFVLNNLWSNVFPQDIETIYETFYEIEEWTDSSQNLISFSIAFEPDEIDTDALLSMVHQGRSIFIGAFHLAGPLADTLGIKTGSSELMENLNLEELMLQQDSLGLSFCNPSLDPKEVYYYERSFLYSHFTDIDTTNTTILALEEGTKPVLIKVKHGDGALYLCSTPLVFTNYYMLLGKNQEFVAKALAYLPKEDILRTEYYQSGRQLPSTPLRYILSNTALRWAWYITMASLLFFVAFEAKRKQRIIPVVVPPKNTTLEFTKTIGRLYYQNADHKNLAEKKILYFFESIRTNYFIPTNTIDEAFYVRLSQKSGRSLTEVKQLFNTIKTIQSKPTISAPELSFLSQQIEAF